MNDIELLTKYISVWGWHLIGVMFFITSVGFYSVRRPLWFFSLILVFMFCEIMAWRRKGEVLKLNNGSI